MSDTPSPDDAPRHEPAAEPPPRPQAAPPTNPGPQQPVPPLGNAVAGTPAARQTALWFAIVVLAAAIAALAFWLNNRLYSTQAEIASRLQAASTKAIEAQTLTKQAADTVRDLTGRIAVLESRQQDVIAQRQALEQLYADVAKSRDQARLAETGQLIALAQQQAQLVGNVQPLIITLQAASDRLSKTSNPQAQILRRAIQADLSKLRSAVTPDIDVAARKLDQLAGMVDDLRLVADAAPLPEAPSARAASASAPLKGPHWAPWLGTWFAHVRETVLQLFGVTRVGDRDALLASPEQGAFVRENLKLRILNARLDLLSRNARAYQSDMHAILQTLQRFFDKRQPQAAQALSLARQAQQIDLSANPAAHLESLAVLSTLDVGSP